MLLKKSVIEPVVGIKAKSLADVYAVLHDRLYDTIVVGAKRFQRERSEEDIQFEWERNKQRLFNMVTKKAKVVRSYLFIYLFIIWCEYSQKMFDLNKLYSRKSKHWRPTRAVSAKIPQKEMRKNHFQHKRRNYSCFNSKERLVC